MSIAKLLKRVGFGLALSLSATPYAQEVSLGDVSTLADAVRQSTSLTEEERAPLLVSLTNATNELEAATKFSEAASSLQLTIESSADEISRYRSQIEDMETLPPTVERRLGESPALADIEAEIDLLEAQRRSWIEQREDLQQLMNSNGAGDVPLQSKLTSIRAEVAAIPDTPLDSEALKDRVAATLAMARKQKLTAEAAKLEIEVRGSAELKDLRTAQSIWLDTSIGRVDKLLPALREAASSTRQSATKQRFSEISRLLDQLETHRSEVIEYSNDNRALVEKRIALDSALEMALADTAELRAQLEYIREDSALTKRRIELTEVGGQLAEVILTRLTSLPDVRDIESGIDTRNDLIAQVSVDVINTEEALRGLKNRGESLSSQFVDLESWDRLAKRILNRLFDQRRELIRDNLDTQNRTLRLLIDSNQLAEELVISTSDYQELLTANLLWTRNYAYADPARLAAQIHVITDPAPYAEMLPRLPELTQKPLLVLDAVVLVLILAYRKRMVTAREALLGNPLRPSEESIGKILKGLSYAFLLALPVPLALVVIAGAPINLNDGLVELEALGEGLRAGAFTLFCLDFLRSITSRIGTGRRLLKWNGQKLEALQRDVSWAIPLTSLCTAIAVYGHGISAADAGGPIAAASTFILSLGSLGYFVRVLATDRFAGDLLYRNALRGGATLSAAIAFMHLSGHVFAAHLYLKALAWTLGAGIVVILISSILQRWILIYEGRLQRQQREDLQAAAEASAESADAQSGERPEEVSEHDIDAVASLSEAQSQLLALARILAFAGLIWVIWLPALPAIAVLNDIVLWSTYVPSTSGEELRTISMATLLLALAILVSTVLLARHLPPLVQIVLMEYGNTSAGARYATGMLMQYVIVGAGASICLSLMGFAWSKVQWLVAALGVGIGFGLQEIVANFISGIILLFERPIRPGDLITVGEHEGTVSRINPRATIIETFDRKEVIVPNKELITGVVNNWSLSSSTLRGVIPVGVAYGTDVQQAIDILYDIAHQEPRVLDDPKPLVTFEDFGDNALMLWLRCYGTGDYLQLWTDLRVEIYRRLNEAEIGIAFPQRDVHVDASSPIPVRVMEGTETNNP